MQVLFLIISKYFYGYNTNSYYLIATVSQ